MKIYTSLNKAGRQHVAESIQALGLNWDIDATCAEIEDKCTDVPEGEEPRSFEVSQGVFIELAAEHFDTEVVDKD